MEFQKLSIFDHFCAVSLTIMKKCYYHWIRNYHLNFVSYFMSQVSREFTRLTTLNLDKEWTDGMLKYGLRLADLPPKSKKEPKDCAHIRDMIPCYKLDTERQGNYAKGPIRIYD